MIIVNKLDNRSFGPFASSAGFFIFIIGLILAFFHLAGIILALVGAFVAFTSTCTIIDTDSKRVKHADYLFGFLPFGKWINIQPGMKLGLQVVKRGYRGYIRGTTPVDIQHNDIRIFLFDSANHKMLAVKKFSTAAAARKEMESMASDFKLQII